MLVVNPETRLEKAACRVGLAATAVTWIAVGLCVALVRFGGLSYNAASLIMGSVLVFSVCAALILLAADTGYYCRKGAGK